MSKKNALALAIRFHETYERLAPSFGYETRPDTKVFDPESKNGRLMVAVCEALADGQPVAWGASRNGEQVFVWSAERPARSPWFELHGYAKARRIGMLAMVGGKDKTRIRNATPPEFRDLLLSIARACHG